MKTRSDKLMLVALGLWGFIIWLSITLITHRREAWDSKYYFSIGIPLLLTASFIAGFSKPGKAIWWGFAVVLLQPVTMFTMNGIGSLFTLGILVFISFALLFSFSAFVGGLLKKLFEEEKK
jgi:hypothetical protein